jgi:uncharacterized lipoprotein YddW (UPF0748 family)
MGFLSLPRLNPSGGRNIAITASSTEVRGVWLTNVASSVLFAPWGVNQAINRLSQLNFNTLYPVVWNRGYTFYPSNVAQKVTGQLQEPLLTVMRSGSDVLGEIVEVAHKKGLTVLPWFEYGLIVPINSLIFQQHPQWFSQNLQGKYFPKSNLDEMATTDTDKSQSSRSQSLKNRLVWLNPFHPEVQQFIKNLVIEVVINYDVDGIQFDDHFGLPVELGYDPVTVKLYQQDHRGKKPPNNYRDPEWMRWRAAKLTAFFTDIVQTVKYLRPEVRISLSPNSHRFSYQNYLQDWKTWVQRGLIDELILQVYRDNPQQFQAELSSSAVQLARKKIPVSVAVLTGTLHRPVKIKQIEQQIKIARERGFAGVSFFYWETLWGYLTPESPHQRRQAFKHIFAQPALRPELAQTIPEIWKR